MKTPSNEIAAIRKWQKANPDKVRAAHHRYEVAHYTERKAAKAAWAQRKRAGKVRGIGRAAGLRMLRERERAGRQA
jgi:hypothetical protein